METLAVVGIAGAGISAAVLLARIGITAVINMIPQRPDPATSTLTSRRSRG